MVESYLEREKKERKWSMAGEVVVVVEKGRGEFVCERDWLRC